MDSELEKQPGRESSSSPFHRGFSSPDTKGKGKGNERVEPPATQRKLPWARYVDPHMRPVVEWTLHGPLLIDSSGTIFVTSLHGKAYCIEVLLNMPPETTTEEFYNSILGSDSYPPSHHPPTDGGSDFEYLSCERSMLQFVVALASARFPEGWPEDGKAYGHALLATNVGNERFDGVVPHLDLEAWMGSDVELEEIHNLANRGVGDNLERFVRYKAREIKLKPRETDRRATSPTYRAQMPLPLSNNLKISSGNLRLNYPIIWGASAGHLSFPNFSHIDMTVEKLTERWRMAKKTASHAKENLLKEKSECSWEFDAWRDLFSKIRDSPLLAMDKHRIDFLEKKDLGRCKDGEQDIALGAHIVLSTCTPDCTFGLATASANESSRGRDNKNHHYNPVLTAENLLNATCLRDLYLHSKPALTSDPKLMNFSLAFPWAVYEAKKRREEKVYTQIERASEIYLRILHDLALEPGTAAESRPFQSEGSSHFKIFSWTSEGPNWKMFVCYHEKQVNNAPLWLPAPKELPQYKMRMIWEGDITKKSRAWELHYLIDWVHNWAQNEFRSSVSSQLRKWHNYGLDVYGIDDAASQDYSSEIKIGRKQLENISSRFEIRKKEIAASKEPDNIIILDEMTPPPDFVWVPPWWARAAREAGKKTQVMKHLGLGNATTGKRRLSGGNSPRTPRKRRRRQSSEIAERQAEQEGDIVNSFE